jgi:hypothetical protein
MVMVSFKGSFVDCLFYLDGYGVVQGIFLFVLSLYLWCRARDLLFFACFTFIFMVLQDTITIKIKQVKNKRSIARHHNYKDKTNKQQKIP